MPRRDASVLVSWDATYLIAPEATTIQLAEDLCRLLASVEDSTARLVNELFDDIDSQGLADTALMAAQLARGIAGDIRLRIATGVLGPASNRCERNR